MKIAIIEENDTLQEKLKEITKGFDWDIDFFINPHEFGHTRLNGYDVIISDYDLQGINGRDLIKSISSKTDAQLFLIGESFNKEDVSNNKIKGLIDKRNIENIIEQLKYVDVKLRLNHMLEKEQEKFNSIIPSNGFTFNKKEDILILTITELLTESSRKKIENEIKNSGLKKLIMSISITGIISSTYLGMIVYFYKFMKEMKGSMIFLNRDNKALTEQINLCNLSMLFPVVDSMEKAINSFR